MTTFKVIVAICALPIALCAQQTKTRNVNIFSHVSGSYLGMGVLEVDSNIAKAAGLKDEHGVQVTQVDADSPAAKAGLQVHDIVLEFNGQRIEGTEQFIRMVSETPVGRKVTLAVFRNGASQTLTAQIGARPAQTGFDFQVPMPFTPPNPPSPPSAPRLEFTMPDIPSGLLGWQNSSLGYTSEPLNGQLAEFFGVKEGVLVRSVVAKSQAEKAGLKAGDVIVKADGSAVRNPRDISNTLRRQRENARVTLTIMRGHKELTLELISKNTVAGADSIVM